MQVSFIIPVFNQLAHTRACYRALYEHVPTSTGHEVIWIDDASDAETRDFLESITGNHRVIHLAQNQGFATATNTGAAVASGQWLCLLNNDVELTEGAVAEMIRVADAHNDAGIIGCVQVSSHDGSVDHTGIDFIDGGYPVHQRTEIKALQSGPRDRVVPAVTAACCLVNRAWFLNIGGLDTRYRNGFEDVDLCLRAREAGWQIYLANRSIVKHAVSTSQGRGRHEYRNAQKFLERWGPRTAAIERAERLEQARRIQHLRAEAGRPTQDANVRAARKLILNREEDRQRIAETPATVWVDLLRMEPRGANGGIKPLVYGFLQEMTTLAWKPLRFVVIAQPGLLEELDFLRPSDVITTKSGSNFTVHRVGKAPDTVSFAEFETANPPEVLYCPFGTSVFGRGNLPMVALLVDSLHRDLPSALPLEEVNFREDSFKRAIGAATWIQTLARHGIDRLQHHFEVHPSYCFHTYASVQQRLTGADTPEVRPDALPNSKFFFYPANFWPHKNHEILITAYHQYAHNAGAAAWPLLLTGHPDARMKTLQQMSNGLGLQELVTFAGHLPDDAFKAVWEFAGALVFPSLHEGFGIPLVEAFQSELPVLAAQTSVLPEVGQDACAWFDPRDPRDLAETMQRVTEDANLRESLIAQGTAQLSRYSRHYEAAKLNHFLYAAARNLVP